MKQLQTVAIIGAGPLGRKLAWLSSRAGFQTMLEDLMPSNIRKAAADLEALQATVRQLGSAWAFAGKS